MLRVYVAGPYSADNVMDVLENMRKGIRLSTDVMLAGFAPFCPWLDFLFKLVHTDSEQITLQDYYNYSMAWLEVADAMLLVSGWDKSEGTKIEIKRAMELHIPRFRSLERLIIWSKYNDPPRISNTL